ncbi:DUF5625 family protein [Pseudomonas sp. FEN]|uniref:DUF5625 family protein n=1 Tax=Pseudomonas sp. FEN TaxID=2767468 RepID=UPI0019B6512F|nr:DUF5625 family protein [Pseudomonas sp. FEN]CAD5201458.1 hypothetical protein [Pseudomonas sp. FEN]
MSFGGGKGGSGRALLMVKRIFIVFVYVLLMGCSHKVLIVRPIDVSLSGHSAVARFSVEENGNYRFALLFVWSKSITENEARRKLWGGGVYNEKGVPIPIRLRILKDDVLFFDEHILTSGINSGQAFEYEGDYKSTQVRDIKYLELSPGEYSVEAITLEEIEAFRGTESYVEFSYYNPKI